MQRTLLPLDGRRRIDVVVRPDGAYRRTPKAVCQTLIRTPAGRTGRAYVEQLRAPGPTLPDAVREGAAVRLPRVRMMALIADVGVIPMAVSRSAGAEVRRPLATVVIGGLVSATLLTLLVLPTVRLRAADGRRCSCRPRPGAHARGVEARTSGASA